MKNALSSGIGSGISFNKFSSDNLNGRSLFSVKQKLRFIRHSSVVKERLYGNELKEDLVCHYLSLRGEGGFLTYGWAGVCRPIFRKVPSSY